MELECRESGPRMVKCVRLFIKVYLRCIEHKRQMTSKPISQYKYKTVRNWVGGMIKTQMETGRRFAV